MPINEQWETAKSLNKAEYADISIKYTHSNRLKNPRIDE